MPKKTLIIAIFISAFLISTVAGLNISKVAKANFTPLPTLPAPIYIRSDGSVDPSTAPIQRVGDIYRLTNSINNTIEIQRSNIALNCNGFTVTNPPVNTEGLMVPIGWLPGISLFGVSNITIVNATLQNCITGIRAENSTNVTIIQNAIKGGTDGIAVFSSIEISIVNNSIQSSSTGINFLPSNPNAIDSSEIKIEQNIIFGTGKGISGSINNSQITNNTLTGTETALNYAGSNNLITGNIFQNSNYGIWFVDQLSLNSTFFRNDFDGNSRNVVVPFIRDPPLSHWDNGTVGNYWSDYNGADSDGDGIGDSPYVFVTTYYDYGLQKNVTLEEGRDNYPLIAPVKVGNIPWEPSQSPSPSPAVSPSPSASTSTSASPPPTPIASPSPTPAVSEFPTPTLSNSPTQQPTPEPSLTPVDGPYKSDPDFGWIPHVAIAVVIIILAILIYLKKIKK